MFDCMRLFKLKLDKPIQCLCKKLILQTKTMKAYPKYCYRGNDPICLHDENNYAMAKIKLVKVSTCLISLFNRLMIFSKTSKYRPRRIKENHVNFMFLFSIS